MNKAMVLLVPLVTIAFFLAAGTGFAQYSRSTACSQCHPYNPGVLSLEVTFINCTGNNAHYEVVVGGPYADSAKAFGVFKRGSSLNVANGFSTGSFNVTAGSTYDVWGVNDCDNCPTEKGGSTFTTISPDCGPS